MPLPSSHHGLSGTPELGSKVVQLCEPSKKHHAEWIKWRINFSGSSYAEAFEELHNLNPNSVELNLKEHYSNFSSEGEQ